MAFFSKKHPHGAAGVYGSSGPMSEVRVTSMAQSSVAPAWAVSPSTSTPVGGAPVKYPMNDLAAGRWSACPCRRRRR